MKQKYIHYCWFGNNPLPKLAMKCIESWKKYLPDFQIIRWDETNTDLNECPFIKEAYENKKWAFVADYVRSKAMNEMGGIYFDTDMEITKNIDYLFKNKSFIGVEDSGKIACGVWYEETKNSKLSKYLLDFYKKQQHFDIDKMQNYCIPILITNFYYKYGFKENFNENQELECGTKIYTRDYFYPLSYDHQNNVFTNNTCMIHYYDASWVPKTEKKSIQNIRKNGKFGNNIYLKAKKIAKIILFPIVKYRYKKVENNQFNKEIERLENIFNNIENTDYIVLCNRNWIGVKNATKELFENVIEIGENAKTYDYIFEQLKKINPRLIIFSGFYDKWEYIVNKINKDTTIKIKILWHGSNAMNVEDYDWNMYKIIFNLLNNKKIVSIGFVKKSMYELYKKLGYNVEFVMNRVEITNRNEYFSEIKNKKNINIGLYASGDRWVKNFYNQLAGTALIKKSIVDVIPISTKIEEYAKYLKVKVIGSKNISHNEMLYRLAQNDVNVYTTFVECAPIIPLESLELGVPCITGNNHHYWEGTELEKYLIVNRVDDPIEISNKIELVLKNKTKILNIYEKWKVDNSRLSKDSVINFIKTGGKNGEK